MRIERVIGVQSALGEGPLWDVEDQCIYWLDSFGGTVMRCGPSGAEFRAWETQTRIGSMALRAAGGAVLATDQGVLALDFDTGSLTLVSDVEASDPNVRLNDGKVDRDGRFVFGSLTLDGEPRSNLYTLELDRTVSVIEQGIYCTNGPCWSPDGRTFYLTESLGPDRGVFAYDYEAGKLANRRKLNDPGDDPYVLNDGATVDAEGFIWSAMYGGASVIRYRPDGAVDRVVELPMKTTSSVMFGGPDLDILYVTSSAENLLPREDGEVDAGPWAGDLVAIHGLGVRGLPETRFAG
ncbi:SMP-30/gluconolactonase/LRE family protein [Sporichthya brevicatena]|uniref:SMP-30/gluconolactonase/LRE family protein n=1 Tax=Sporichthya brevicatena TaxID=171442 RepID=A0ABP3RJW7_9ACTN